MQDSCCLGGAGGKEYQGRDHLGDGKVVFNTSFLKLDGGYTDGFVNNL